MNTPMIVYNLFPLLAGPFPVWAPHLERAASMGFDWIFVNPVHRPGASGSLYSVADYFSLNPFLVEPDNPRSPEDQLRDAIKAAEEHGLRVMIDLVINHCAADSELVHRHPQWFRRHPDGTIVHPSAVQNGSTVVWKDLAQFDHAHTPDPGGLFRHCLDVVDYLIGLGFRGFRCDAAYQVPTGIWVRLMDEVKAMRADTVFAAETLGCTALQTRETASAGFDYIFNSVKWWDFRSPWLLQQYELTRQIAPSIGFPESHDTERLAQETDGDLNALRQRYLFAAAFSTGCMIPIGFEFGFRRPLHVVATRPDDWETTDVDLREFIAEVNATKAAHPVLHEEGPALVLRSGNPKVLAFWKEAVSRPEEVLVLLNTDLASSQSVYIDDLRRFVQAGTPLVDVSPGDKLDYVPVSPFTYDLRPGQGLMFVTRGEDDR